MNNLISILIIFFILSFSSLSWAVNCPDRYDFKLIPDGQNIDDFYSPFKGSEEHKDLSERLKETKAWKNLTANEQEICIKEINKFMQEFEEISKVSKLKLSKGNVIFLGIVTGIFILLCKIFYELYKMILKMNRGSKK